MNKSFFTKLFSALLIVMLALGALPITPAYAANTGLLSPTASVAGATWTNPNNAFSSNNVYATSGNGGQTVNYTTFGITIPAGQQIDGIEVLVEGTTTGRDITVELSWNNGANYTAPINLNFGGGADQTLTAGGAANTWGRSWNPTTDFTNANFRVRITSTGGGGTFSMDHVQVRVTYTPDVAPTFTSIALQNPATSPTNANTLVFRATFSEGVQNVSTGDFTVTGTTATVTGVAVVSASVYDVTVTGGDLAALNGTVGLNLAAGQNIQDLTGNALPNAEPATDQTYVVDNTAPSVVSFVIQNPATSPTNANTLVFRITFSENVTNISAADFDVNGTTANITGFTTVTADTVFDLTVSGGDLAGLNGTVSVNLDVTGGGQQDITDTAGNALPNPAPNPTPSYVVDNTAPTATITHPGQADPTSTLPINFRVTFNEAITISSFINTDITNGGTAAGTKTVTITEIAPNNGTTFNVAVNGLTGSGTVTISLAANTFQDAAGNNNTAASTNTDNSVQYNALATPTLSITNSPLTYTGSPQAAVVTCSSGGAVSNILYGGSATVPTNAGTYAVTADCAAMPGFTALTGASAGNFVINPINQTANVTNSPQSYTGAAQSATVSCSGGGVATNISTGGSASQTNAGTYAVTADCPAVAPNYNAGAGLAAGNFVINPINQTANVTNSPQNYTGAAQSATVSCSGGGVATNISTGGAASQTNAGTYAVTADCPAVAPNYNAGAGLAAGNFVINPINQTANVTNSPQNYTGAAQSATVSCSGGGIATNISTGGAASQTNAGTYAVTADCPAAAPNYNAGTGLAAGNFVINQINPTASITNSPVIYNGAAQTATVACLGGGAATLASGGTGTNVGSYPATVDCAASTNYTAAAGLAAGNFVINPATPTASITNSPVIYNGSVQTAIVACSGGGVATLASGGTGTNVGSYPATVDCAASANYTAAAGLTAGNFVINIANQTITVTTSAPTTSVNGSSFNVVATASSGLPVTISVSGVCTVADLDGSVTDGDATVTMTSGSGTCSVFYNQTGDTNFNPAPQVQEDVTATDSPVFTSANNTSFDLGFAGTFNITATGNPSTMVISVSGALPSGVTLTDNGDGTASFSGIPGAGTAGVYNLVLTANNGVLPNGTQNFTLTVRNGPTASNVNSLPDTGDGSLAENESVATTLSITEITVAFSRDVYDVPASTTDPDEVDNPANYILVRSTTGVFNTLSCAGGVVAPDIINPITSVTYDNGGGSGPFVATLTLTTPLTTEGYYRLFVCGTTSIVDAVNTGLSLAGDGVTPGTDFVRNFQLVAPAAGGGGGGGAGARENALAVAALPATGFAPGRITKLPVQPDELAYSDLGEMWIEIPSLGIKTSIVGVPQTADGEWDVTWLANNVGWLNGTAFPTWEGNSVVTAHVTNADGVDGPFSNLKKLKYGDQIIIHLYGQKYIFEVRNSRLSRPFTTSFAFEDLEDASYLTLITCQTYLPKSDSYMHRRVVRAVLISVENE